MACYIKRLNKLKEENEQLKKENQIIREGNDYIGVFQQDLKDKFQKLSNDMTANVKAAIPVVKKYNHNVLFMKSVQALIRFNTELEQILKNLQKIKLSEPQRLRSCSLHDLTYLLIFNYFTENIRFVCISFCFCNMLFSLLLYL